MDLRYSTLLSWPYAGGFYYGCGKVKGLSESGRKSLHTKRKFFKTILTVNPTIRHLIQQENEIILTTNVQGVKGVSWKEVFLWNSYFGVHTCKKLKRTLVFRRFWKLSRRVSILSKKWFLVKMLLIKNPKEWCIYKACRQYIPSYSLLKGYSYV